MYLMDWRFWLAVVVVSLATHWAWNYFTQGKGSS